MFLASNTVLMDGRGPGSVKAPCISGSTLSMLVMAMLRMSSWYMSVGRNSRDNYYATWVIKTTGLMDIYARVSHGLAFLCLRRQSAL